MACVIMDFIKAMQDNDAALCVCVTVWKTLCVPVCVSVCVPVCVRTPIQSTPCVTNKFIKRSQCLLQNIIRARGEQEEAEGSARCAQDREKGRGGEGRKGRKRTTG